MYCIHEPSVIIALIAIVSECHLKTYFWALILFVEVRLLMQTNDSPG